MVYDNFKEFITQVIYALYCFHFLLYTVEPIIVDLQSRISFSIDVSFYLSIYVFIDLFIL